MKQWHWSGSAWGAGHTWWASPSWKFEAWKESGSSYQSDAREKADLTDPPVWPGWAHFRLWRKALVDWDKTTDVAVRRRAQRIFKLFDWDLRAKFDHLDPEELRGEKYLDKILHLMGTMVGEKEGDEQRRAVRNAVYDFQRRREETLTQFVARREQQLVEAARYEIKLPENVKG